MIFYGLWTNLPLPILVIGLIVLFFALGFTGAAFWLWALAGAAVLFGLGAPVWVWWAFAALVLLFGVPPIRRVLITSNIMRTLKAMNFLPTISDTERTAIEAGNIWVDGELFSGKPNLKRLMSEPYPELSEEEKAFLDGPAEEACRLTDAWKTFKQKDLDPEVWEYIKKNRFLGLIIPKAYGGLGFSALGNSAVAGKLATRSAGLGNSVSVPNSLGPAELLLHYGTEEQKQYYLPRLARGEEMPCFALTEPHAGSDAGSLTSSGEVFRGEDGKLYIRLNWNKRYITLSAVSTVLGLAFKLRDPENLLGKGPNPGITLALIPTDTPGVVLDRRHDPLGIPFYNGPTEGHDVVVPVDAIIGGPEQAGNGWRFLMESLAVGRGITLPAGSAAGIKYAARVAGAYATVRKQFGLSIGRFEGVEEPLARIGGFAYVFEAARRYTCGGLDSGQKPSVVTAMAKYSFTEHCRKALNDAMDVLGGAGISMGPRNLLAQGYIGMPISITVEGANILTRTLMIFGQGAIRCHPYAYPEIKALTEGDLKGFDTAFWGHVGHVVRNLCRSLGLSLTRGRLASAPVGGAAAPYFRKLAWASASFAFLADVAMALYGGDLKRKGKLTGRFADIFIWLYLATATLRRFEAEGRRKEDLPLLHWGLQYAFAQIQQAFDGLFENLPFPFKGVVAFWSRLNPISRMPYDALGSRVAQILQTPGEQRDRLTDGIYLPKDPNEGLGRLEHAFQLVYEAEGIWGKVRRAVREGKVQKDRPEKMVEQAVANGVLTQEEAALLARAEEARNDAIQVDAFPLSDFPTQPPLRTQVKKQKTRPRKVKAPALS